MNRPLTAITASLVALSAIATAMPVQARDYGRDDRPGWHGDRDRDRGRDRDRDHRRDRWDRDNHRDREWNDRRGHRWRYYGGSYGYGGYDGRWRVGQRYPYWRDRSYVITDYSYFGLPAPRPGYRYYRDGSGDIVMAAIAGGVIGLIIGSAIR